MGYLIFEILVGGFCAGVGQVAEKADSQAKSMKNAPQGLKPIHLIGLIGTTEVVP